MRFTHFGAAAALVATAAHAFLLPPTITEAESDIVDILPFEDALSIKDRVMELSCPGCPVSVTDIEGKVHTAQAESVLRLNFTLAFNGQGDQLLLNGHPLYPVDPLSSSFTEPLTADQVVKSPDGSWQYAASPKLGYALAVAHPSGPSSDEMGLVTIKLEILEVVEKFIHGIPPVVLKLVETPSGKLMIGDAEIVPTPSSKSAPSDSNKECTTTLCKWRAIIADKLSKVKGCAGKKGNDHGKQGGVRPHGHGRPRPHGAHRPHRHHHRRGGFARFLRSIVLHVFIPIMIGVVVGVTTSLIGMVAGHLIVFIWRTLFRRGQRGQYCRLQQEVIVEDGDDKKFLEPQGPPPIYEAVLVDEKASE